MIPAVLIQTKKNIQENSLTTISGIITTCFSLIILGVSILVYTNLIHLTQDIFQQSNCSLFLDESIIGFDRYEIINQVKEIPDTSNIKQISSEKAKRDLIQSFGKSGEILNEIEIPELPSIIEFSVSRLSGLTDKEMEKLDSMPGVVEVVTGFETREQIHTFFSITEFVGIFLISLLIMSIISIIHNSIQISIRMRIEEIEILKILGAKPGFIRLPYLIEGIFIAFCGALAAIGFIYFLYQFVLAGITFNESTYGIREITQFFSIIQIGGFLILISILGFLSSLLATNKIINELTV